MFFRNRCKEKKKNKAVREKESRLDIGNGLVCVGIRESGAIATPDSTRVSNGKNWQVGKKSIGPSPEEKFLVLELV